MESKYELVSSLWELTLRCSLNCMHCGSVGGSARKKELTLEECYPVADELKELGCQEMTFIGGEIFLYKGWEKLGNYLTGKGMVVNLMSNGFSIGDREIEQIKFAGLSNVGISIDGMEETHNLIRRNKESFSRIQEAMNRLNKAGIEIGVVTSLMEINYPDLEELYDFLAANNVKLWQLQLVNPMGNMSGQKKMIIKAGRIPEITTFIREKNNEYRMLVVAGDSIGYHDENEFCIRGRTSPFTYWGGCQAGISSLFIDSVGNIKGCGALYEDTFIEGNIRETSLSEIWNNKNNFSYNRKYRKSMLKGNCKHCETKEVCKGGCRASNYFMTGSLYENAFCRMVS
ncbi:MAG: radical SAM protein [Bacteroidetes bacterium]|nr:radical SAM protein [Bacteroidota bacterium]